MYLSPLERLILMALRHGPLDHFQVAADIQAAPFMVRASLKRLKSERRVREILNWHSGHLWELTGSGHRVADELAGGKQLTLGETA